MKNYLKIERAKKDLTQDDLAKLINVSRQTIVAIEKNKFAPSTVLALKLSAVFECKVDELFELDEDD